MQLIPAWELLLQQLVSPPASHRCSLCPSGRGLVKEKNQPLDAGERITPRVQLLQGVLNRADPIKWRIKLMSQHAATAQLFRAAWRSGNQGCAFIKWLIDYCQPVIMWIIEHIVAVQCRSCLRHWPTKTGSAAAQLFHLSVEVTAEPTGSSAHAACVLWGKRNVWAKGKSTAGLHVRSDWQVIAEALGFP